jgi:hypothetical protein
MRALTGVREDGAFAYLSSSVVFQTAEPFRWG